MDWSSVLGNRLRLGVDKANAATGSGKEAPVPFSFSSIKKRREQDTQSSKATPTKATAATGSGKEAPAPSSLSSIKKLGANSSKATPQAGGVRKYIKTLSVLTILVVIFSIMIVGIAIMTASSKTFDVDSITENDIPLAIGAGIGQTSVMAALFSTISPMDLLEEIDLDKDKKQNEDERKKNKNNKNKKKNINYKKNKNNNKNKNKNKKNKMKKSKRKIKRLRRSKPRTRVMRPRKMPARSLRKSPRGIRFLRGLLRLLIRR